MDEMIRYIFGNLRASSNALKIVGKTLQHQERINRSIAVLSLAVTAYVIVAEIRNQEQHDKIERLSHEIEELKRVEGV